MLKKSNFVVSCTKVLFQVIKGNRDIAYSGLYIDNEFVS